MSVSQQEVAQKLVALINSLQPSIAISGSKLEFKANGQTFQIDRFSSTPIATSTARFR